MQVDIFDDLMVSLTIFRNILDEKSNPTVNFTHFTNPTDKSN